MKKVKKIPMPKRNKVKVNKNTESLSKEDILERDSKMPKVRKPALPKGKINKNIS